MMTIEDLKGDMEMCSRCSLCKFIPVERVKGYDHVGICPSVARFNFHAYSGGGRINMAVACLQGRAEITDKLTEIVYNCNLCGGCDVACKYVMDMDVHESISQFRLKCVREGHTLPTLDRAMDLLAREGTLVPPSGPRGAWAEGLGVKDATTEKVEVLFHGGCRGCFDPDAAKAARTSLSLLKMAGVDVGIAGDRETCCGGRAYQMGYEGSFLRQAGKNLEFFESSGAKTLVTGCADCYYAFKVLYDKFGMRGGMEVLHTTEYFDRLIAEGRLKPGREVAANVTYHDPCHLGRLGEPYIHWEGKEVPGHMRVFDPPREFRRGTKGVFDPPRSVLRSIPGLTVVEMDRTKEYSWCCGAGGGVTLTNPEFARWTAGERVAEAESTGAEAIVTACPGCMQSLKDAVTATGSRLKVYEIGELLEKAIEEGGS
jgi:Fe-S oxidoreductase